MPTIEAQLQTLLGNLCAGRCYPLINTTPTIVSPYITFQVIDAAPMLVSANSAKQEKMRVQVDVFGTTYSSAKTLAQSVKTAIDTASFAGTSLITNMDLYEEASKEYRVLLEFYIWP